MADPRSRVCGSCCRGDPPMRKNFNESLVCVCGAPFFSQIVAENNLQMHRRSLIGIPMEYMEDHGSKFDRVVIFEEEGGVLQRVTIGGNLFVGFGFEWEDFAQTRNIGVGHVVVFTLLARSRFLVQVYDPALARAKPSDSGKAFRAPNHVAPKVESVDDDVKVAVAQDWLSAKATKSGAASTDNITAPKVKVENLEMQGGKAIEAPKRVGESDDHGTNCGMVPKTENVEVQRKVLEQDCPDLSNENEGPSVPTDLDGQFVQLTPPNTRLRAKKIAMENDKHSPERSSSSTSDSVWHPRSSGEEGSKRHSRGRKRKEPRGRKKGLSSPSDEENMDFVDASDDDSDDDDSAEINFQHGDGEENPPLVEAPLFKKIQDWAKPGTSRGRTYVSKRRPVTEAEIQRALDAARDYPVTHPSFLKQLSKDTCYRSTRFFPPAPFFKQHMIPRSRASYVATLMDDEGKCWPTRIKGKRIHWKNFTLDHYLEEDDVVVFELVDSRLESFKFLVHIFRVVDVKVTLTGLRGWKAHYTVVEGTKKQWCEERRRFLKDQAEGRRKKKNRHIR